MGNDVLRAPAIARCAGSALFGEMASGSILRFFLLSGLAGASLSAADEDFTRLKLETFDSVWQQVADSYYDATFGGLDWAQVGARYRASLDEIDKMDELRRHLREMLHELGDSHLAIISSGVGSEDLEPSWGGGTANATLCFAGKLLAFANVREDGAAFRAGIRPGDVLLEMDGQSVSELRRETRKSNVPRHLVEHTVYQHFLTGLSSRVGAERSLLVKSPRETLRRLTLKLDRYDGRVTQPLGNIGPMPFEYEERILPGDVGYLRFGLWFPAVMPDIRKMVTGLPDDAAGLVIDLRGNVGGIGIMAGGVAGLLLDEQAVLGTTHLREGHVNFVGFPQKGAFLGPVAVLVDETSLSTSEVFAIGLQEYGRIRVFGRRTPGAALPSVVTKLPNGDLLQIALGDFRTPAGTSLEGRGVIPDERVRISPVDLSLGRDKVLDAAVGWIRELNQQPR